MQGGYACERFKLEDPIQCPLLRGVFSSFKREAKGILVSENFPFNTVNEFLNSFKKDKPMPQTTPTNEQPLAIHAPAMPAVPKEDLVALAQALVLVVLSFAPKVSEQQSAALLALAAILGTILSYSGAKRRSARNSRIESENLALIEAHNQLQLASMGVHLSEQDE